MSNHIGISGWTYGPWRGGAFYPKGLPHKQELAFAARRVNSIEINGTFYALQRPSSFRAWHGATPEGFVFSVKGSRYITHMKKLRDVGAAMGNFWASGVLALREKLGPILWQFPPNLGFDAGRFEGFLAGLPKDNVEAAAIGRRHDGRIKERAYLRVDERRAIRHAVEVRHRSFACDAFLEMLRRHGVAVVVADTAGKWPFIEEMTAGFAYVRLHGDKEIYVSGYSEEALTAWAGKIRQWRKRGDVYVYFDNDVKVRAPADAMRLAEMLEADGE